MAKTKIFKLNKLLKQIQLHKQTKGETETIGLIVGSFDVIYSDHVKLFRKAKKYADILVVGVENDQNVRISKGYPRPIELLEDRMEVLAELQSIDYIFPIEDKYSFYSPVAYEFHETLLSKLKPDFWFSNENFDTFAELKKTIAKALSVKFVSP